MASPEDHRAPDEETMAKVVRIDLVGLREGDFGPLCEGHANKTKTQEDGAQVLGIKPRRVPVNSCLDDVAIEDAGVRA